MLFLDQSRRIWCLWLRTTYTIYGMLQERYMCGSLIATSLSNGRMFLANLVAKTCTCKVWDYEKIACLHGLAAYIYYTKRGDDGVGMRRDVHIHYHKLCLKYYWAELWALAYSKTLYVVPDKSSWNVPDDIKELNIIPPTRITRKGRRRVKRHPSCEERRKRTQNKKRRREKYGFNWFLFGNGASPPA